MASGFAYFAEANIVCIILFGIMLLNDLLNVDRQKKQIMYDRVLMASMAYFASNIVVKGVETGVLPASMFNFVVSCLASYVLGVGVTYTWLQYVLAFEKTPYGDRLADKIALLSPFFIVMVALSVMYTIAPSMLMTSDFKTTLSAYVIQAIVPGIYIIAILVYALRQALKEKNPIERRKHLLIGFFPLIVVAGSLIELFFPALPTYCFGCVILMLVFYIQSMQSRVSVDPLTGLNNRGQLARYTSQDSNIHQEGRSTYVVMMDVNDFKGINDTYGHAEGDKALTIVASALKGVARSSAHPVFLCRYGGDEFLLIARPSDEGEIEQLVDNIRVNVEAECKARQTPYLISIGIGYDMIDGEEDTFARCLKRADRNLYVDKQLCKSTRPSSSAS